MKVKTISVVLATYNRLSNLKSLLQDLAEQQDVTIPLEVIVVDDGSKQPVAADLQALQVPYTLHVETQANAGAAAARHRGVLLAKGDIVVLLDDDMRVPHHFLAAHLAAHQAGATVVLGHIAPSKQLAKMPLFERFHAAQLARFVQGVAQGKIKVRGVHVCSGNVSFRRKAYLAVGGFDPAFARSEDRELGIRLEKAGEQLIFSHEAISTHDSDHTSLAVWLKRCLAYGQYDYQIGQKHPDIENADPWRFLLLVHPISRSLLMLPVVLPTVGTPFARLLWQVTSQVDGIGWEKGALMGATLVYGVEYFHGVRLAAGTLPNTLTGLWQYLVKRAKANQDNKEPSGQLLTALGQLLSDVQADYASVQKHRAKYHAELVPWSRMPIDWLRKIGFQTATVVRLMQFSKRAELPLLPQLLSRLLRHLYACEIHWDANIAGGISIVHGVGLVISHAATVEPGCILFHQVTLGEGIDSQTRKVGAPHLERDVHVGPGSTLLGPIRIGAGSKIMAGSVVTTDVPAHSIVRPAEVRISPRGKGISSNDK